MSPLPSVPAAGTAARHVAGWALLFAVAAFLAATVVRRSPSGCSLDAAAAAPALAGQQLLVSCRRLGPRGSVLLRAAAAGRISPFLTFSASFVVAILLGMVSHVPGGVGVFEGLMVLLVEPYVPSAQLLPALVVYRAVYYLLPFAVALVALVLDEAYQRRRTWRAPAHGSARSPSRSRRACSPRRHVPLRQRPALVRRDAGDARASRAARPRAAAGRGRGVALHRQRGRRRAARAVAGGGAPAGRRLLPDARPDRRRHGGVAAQGVRLRRGAAAAARAAGAARARPAFDRRAAFFDTRFSAPGSRRWRARSPRRSGSASLPSSTWTTRTSSGGSSSCTATRRASCARSVGAAVVGDAVRRGPAAAARAARGRHAHDGGSRRGRTRRSTTDVAPRRISSSCGDKALLFNEARTGFVMYGVQGRTWVAMGDPVGPDDWRAGPDPRVPRALRRLRRRAGVLPGRAGPPASLCRLRPHVREARRGGARSIWRRSRSTAGRGAKYRQRCAASRRTAALPRGAAGGVPALLPQLRAVSDEWLGCKAGAEKGFSLGLLRRGLPAAVPGRGDRARRAHRGVRQPVAGRRARASCRIDLMRYSATRRRA